MYQTPSGNPEPSQRSLRAILAPRLVAGNRRLVTAADFSLMQECQCGGRDLILQVSSGLSDVAVARRFCGSRQVLPLRQLGRRILLSNYTPQRLI